MTYATTFSGIGGWELGLNACGWELQWQCESEPFCQALLRERFGVPVYPDIRTLCEHNPAPVDALIGSPPCQPFSVAGNQHGTSDERHLYPAFIGAVRQLQPRYVLMEQVPAILSMDGGRAFGEYIGGLGALGYDVLWHCIPACAVGANHQRDRLWIVANSRLGRFSGTHSGQVQQPGGTEVVRASENVAVAGRTGQPRGGLRGWKAAAGEMGNAWPSNSGETLADTTEFAEREELDAPGLAARHSAGRFVAGGANWATEPDVGRVANGIPLRVDRLKGLGNAIVPQIAYLIGQAINQIES